MQTETRPKPKPVVMAERRAEAADRKAAHAAALTDRRVEEARAERDRARADLAEIREDRDRWRAQAERLAGALERLRGPQPPRLPIIAPPAAARQDDDLLYGVPAIAEAFRWRPRQVYHLADKHGLPTFNMGRIVCARRAAVTEWLAAQEAAATQKGR